MCSCVFHDRSHSIFGVAPMSHFSLGLSPKSRSMMQKTAMAEESRSESEGDGSSQGSDSEAESEKVMKKPSQKAQEKLLINVMRQIVEGKKPIIVPPLELSEDEPSTPMTEDMPELSEEDYDAMVKEIDSFEEEETEGLFFKKGKKKRKAVVRPAAAAGKSGRCPEPEVAYSPAAFKKGRDPGYKIPRSSPYAPGTYVPEKGTVAYAKWLVGKMKWMAKQKRKDEPVEKTKKVAPKKTPAKLKKPMLRQPKPAKPACKPKPILMQPKPEKPDANSQWLDKIYWFWCDKCRKPFARHISLKSGETFDEHVKGIRCTKHQKQRLMVYKDT